MWDRSLELILVFCIFAGTGNAGGGNRWAYQGILGPSHWSQNYPDCAGSSQSPVDIDTSLVELDLDLPPFDLTELDNDEQTTMLLENVHGHTVEVHLGGLEIAVSGGGLEGSYGVDQFHFHWGAKDMRGSEHTINNRHFPMEMHIVMHSHKYADINTAMTYKNGLAVLGFFFKIGKPNAAVQELLNHFKEVEYNGNTFEIPHVFPIISLLPANLNVFYRYDGSLTTPPCSETVVWTLFAEHIEVSEAQMETFRDLKRTYEVNSQHVRHLVDDFRPVQPLNGRVIKTNQISPNSFLTTFLQSYWNSLQLKN